MFPGADATTQRFDDNFSGSFSGGPRKGVLHTTETETWPGYDGGASAPHFTVNGTKVRQHFPISMPSRALQNVDGGVRTNRDGAIQIEIVCYSDEVIAEDVGGIKVRELPAATLDTIAGLMRWIEANAGVERKTLPAARWKRFPASFGVGNGVRMSKAEWDAFDGWCGHMHVPENVHGDPSVININHLMGDIDMPLTDEEIEKIAIRSAEMVWNRFKLRTGPSGQTLVTLRDALEEIYKDAVEDDT
jgi:hypothetical protein